MGENHKAEPAANVHNQLRVHRIAQGMSQADLAGRSGITRQAVCAIEANQYLPTTGVALRLADALHCRVEDLFSLISTKDTIEGDLIGVFPSALSEHTHVRVKIAVVGKRVVIRPAAALGQVLNYTVPADGLIQGLAKMPRSEKETTRVTARLLKDRQDIEQEISAAGCDPAIFLAGEHLRRRHDRMSVVGWSMGSAAAVEALRRGEVHIAGLHVVDPKSGESNLPFLRKHLGDGHFTVVTFATWEEGWIVAGGNPKGIRDAGDLVRKDITLINREPGAAARMLLDQKMIKAGVVAAQIQGYEHSADSHFDVARHVAEGRADVGVGVMSAAALFGLDFLPLQEERYDLVIPSQLLKSRKELDQLLNTIVSRSFRTEIEALGGYDTSQTGKVHLLRAV